MIELKKRIEETIKVLNGLKAILIDLKKESENQRIKISISDLNRTLKHAEYYTNDIVLYKKDPFMFDRNLVSLVDSLINNDFGVQLTTEQENNKRILCNGLMEIVLSINKTISKD